MGGIVTSLPYWAAAPPLCGRAGRGGPRGGAWRTGAVSEVGRGGVGVGLCKSAAESGNFPPAASPGVESSADVAPFSFRSGVCGVLRGTEKEGLRRVVEGVGRDGEQSERVCTVQGSGGRAGGGGRGAHTYLAGESP